METSKQPRKRGKPRAVLPENAGAVAEALASQGVPYRSIAAILSIPDATLRKYHGEAMARGHERANGEIVKTLYNKAMGGDTACLIFWCKTQLGWRDASPVQKVDLVSSDGSMTPKAPRAPLTIADLDRLERECGIEELDRLERLCDKFPWNHDKIGPPSGDGSMSPKAAGRLVTRKDLDRVERLCDKIYESERRDDAMRKAVNGETTR